MQQTNNQQMPLQGTSDTSGQADNIKPSSYTFPVGREVKLGPGGRQPKIELKNAIGHFKTITKHRWMVRRNCFKMGLYWQGLTHDLSKYSPTEFLQGCRYYQGDRSPNASEREVNGLSLAWLHHKGRNKHHYEYWIDFSSKDSSSPYGVLPGKMPDRYIAEMIADRVAASRNYRKDAYTSADPLHYYLTVKQTPTPMHPYTIEKLEFFLHMLADKGEEETFAYIKNVFLKNKKK